MLGLGDGGREVVGVLEVTPLEDGKHWYNSYHLQVQYWSLHFV